VLATCPRRGFAVHRALKHGRVAPAAHAGAGDGAANVTPGIPPGGISVKRPDAGGGRAFHTARRSFHAFAPRWTGDVDAPYRNVAHPGEGVRLQGCGRVE
jgi:hypothetical protein